MRALLICLLLAGPAAAQSVPFDINLSISCANSARDAGSRRQCVGRSASACVDRVNSMVERGSCMEQELAYWEYVLGEYLRQSKEKAQREQVLGFDGVTPGHFDEIDTAWRSYSDAVCNFEAAQWGSGSGTAFGAVSCKVKLVGEQALFLYDRWLAQ